MQVFSCFFQIKIVILQEKEMLNSDKLFSKLIDGGYVINREDLKRLWVKHGEEMYARACEKMSYKFGLFTRRKREAAERNKQRAFLELIQEISDFVYEQRQKSYYGENLENHPDKRDGGLSKGEIQVRKRSEDKSVRNPKTF